MCYINIWTAPGLLGSPTRAHSSVSYETAERALKGRDVPPEGGWTLLGTLDMASAAQPKFLSEEALRLQVRDGVGQYSLVLISSGPSGGNKVEVLQSFLVSRDEAEAEYLAATEGEGTVCEPGTGTTLVLLDQMGRPVYACS